MTKSATKSSSKRQAHKRLEQSGNRSNPAAAKKEKLDRLRADLLEKERCKRETAEGKARAQGVLLPRHVKALFGHFEKMLTFIREESFLTQADGLAVTSKWCHGEQ